MSKRTCAYCGESQCECEYRHRRKGSGTAMAMSNTSAQTTIGEMKQEFTETMAHYSDDTHATWQFRFTKLKTAPKEAV